MQDGRYPIARRRFIGPMPSSRVEAALPRRGRRLRRQANTLDDDSSDSDSDADEQARDVVKAYAMRYFLQHGGAEEEWGEGTETRVRREMLRRWRESDWGRIIRARDEAPHNTTHKQQWVGTSFTVGEVPGVGVPEVPMFTSLPRSTSPTYVEDMDQEAITSADALPESSRMAGASTLDTFVTAPSGASLTSSNRVPSSGFFTPQADQARFDSTVGLVQPVLGSASLSGNTGAEFARSPALESNVATLPESDAPTKMPIKGKGKTARFAEPQEELPVPPGDVLARRGSSIEETSAGAAEEAIAENSVKWGDIIMEDRMLVRHSSCNSNLLGVFDEDKCRTVKQDLLGWAEYQVVWRKDELYLYQHSSWPSLQRPSSRRRLAHSISLEKPATILSLFSFTDLSFSLHSRAAHRRNTDIFVFKHQARTRAADWYWQLWCQMGGSIPGTVEVRCPTLDLSLQFTVPAPDDWARVYAMGEKQEVLRTCENALRGLPEWEFLKRRAAEDHDGEMALAWRHRNTLDWITYEEDLDGKKRKWAALWGLAVRQSPKVAHLEFRLSKHRPTVVHLSDGQCLVEPLAIEGYLDRIRPHSRSRQAVYLSTHDGNLVFSTGAHGHPPLPPGAPRTMKASGAYMPSPETCRGSLQILEADGMVDIRSVLVVRRAFVGHDQSVGQEATLATSRPVTAARHQGTWAEGVDLDQPLEISVSDDEDAGGEEALAALATVQSRTNIRTKRSFELVLKSGQIVRLEAYSRSLALEWIRRLRELVKYYRRRHQVDAQSEMDICDLIKPRITPHQHPHHTLAHDVPPPPPRDPDATSPALPSMFPRTYVEDQRCILKCGNLFVRQGTRGQYRNVQLVLVAGHLVQFFIRRASSFNRRGKASQTVQLSHSYLVSGTLAAQALPTAQCDPNAAAIARRYADGLESNDLEEDSLFVLWYRPGVVGATLSHDASFANDPEPPLSKKNKLLVFRARSRLERDAWAFAINAEIERLVRARRDAERVTRKLS